VWFDDTTVQADEISIDQSSKRVEFKGPRKIFLGNDSPCAPPPVKVQYR